MIDRPLSHGIAVLLRAYRRKSEPGFNETSAWFAEVGEKWILQVLAILANHPRLLLSKRTGRVEDHLYGWIADKIEKDGLRKFALMKHLPPEKRLSPSMASVYVLNYAVSEFRRDGQDLMMRSVYGAKTKREMENGVPFDISLPPDCEEQEPESREYLEEALSAIKEAIVRAFPAASDKYLRILSSVLEGNSTTDIMRSEQISKSAASSARRAVLSVMKATVRQIEA